MCHRIKIILYCKLTFNCQKQQTVIVDIVCLRTKHYSLERTEVSTISYNLTSYKRMFSAQLELNINL